jgi:hypothetical protein
MAAGHVRAHRRTTEQVLLFFSDDQGLGAWHGLKRSLEAVVKSPDERARKRKT